MLHSPAYGIIEVVVAVYIGKRAVDGFKLSFNIHLGRGHFEGELAVSLVGHLDKIIILIGHNQINNLVSLVRVDRNGDQRSAGSTVAIALHFTATVLLDNNGIGGTAGAAAAGTAAGVTLIGPMCIHSGIGLKNGVRGHIIAADFSGVPAVKAIVAASCVRQRCQLSISAGLHRGGLYRTAVCIKGDGVNGCGGVDFLDRNL